MILDFGVTCSKVKVTETINVRMVSTHYLENDHKVFIFNILIDLRMSRLRREGGGLEWQNGFC
jgi:hypothetical protein